MKMMMLLGRGGDKENKLKFDVFLVLMNANRECISFCNISTGLSSVVLVYYWTLGFVLNCVHLLQYYSYTFACWLVCPTTLCWKK